MAKKTAAPLVLRREGCDAVSSDRSARHGENEMRERVRLGCAMAARPTRGVVTWLLGGVSAADGLFKKTRTISPPFSQLDIPHIHSSTPAPQHKSPLITIIITTMSGPYDSYGGHQYNQPQGYNPYPAQGYGQQPPPQHQGYPQQPYYPSQDGGYQDQGFAPPARTNSFGPPQHGGFQMGIQGQQYGAYDASNPQGNAGY